MSTNKNPKSNSKMSSRDINSAQNPKRNSLKARGTTRNSQWHEAEDTTCKSLTPTRTIFESKKLNSACVFLKQLRKKWETESIVDLSESKVKQKAISDILDTLCDITDSITPIVSSISTTTTTSRCDRHKSSVHAKQFDIALSATNKICEATKKIRTDTLNNDTMLYYSAEIVASNFQEISSFKDSLKEIGDRIYVDKELLNQLVELYELLKDTIEKLRKKESELQETTKVKLEKPIEEKEVDIGASVEQITISTPRSTTQSLQGSQIVSRNSLVIQSDHAIRTQELQQSSTRSEDQVLRVAENNLEEINLKPESKKYFQKCLDQLNRTKAYLEDVLNDDYSADKEHIKIYKDKKSIGCVKFYIDIDGVPIVIACDKQERIEMVSENVAAKKSADAVNSNNETNDASGFEVAPIDSLLCVTSKTSPMLKSETTSLKVKEKQISKIQSSGGDSGANFPQIPSNRKISYPIADPGSNPDLPYTAAQRSLPNLDDNKICSSLDFDVKTKESSLRDTGVNHPDGKISRALKQVQIDRLLKSCRPAKCCRKTVLNEKSSGRYPYAASLQSLPLLQQDVERVKEIIQSRVKFLDVYPTFSTFDYFQKHSSDHFLYFRNMPVCNFFEIFKRDESKTKVASGSKETNSKPAQNNYEVKILEFLRKFYSSEPMPQKTEKKKKKNTNHKRKRESSPDNKVGLNKKVEAYLLPKSNFMSVSSTSYVSSIFTISPEEKTNEEGKAGQSFLLVPKTKIISRPYKEINTTQSVFDDDPEQKFVSATETIETEIDEASLSPVSYAETLNAIYQLDDKDTVREISNPDVRDIGNSGVVAMRVPETTLATIYESMESKKPEIGVREGLSYMRLEQQRITSKSPPPSHDYPPRYIHEDKSKCDVLFDEFDYCKPNSASKIETNVVDKKEFLNSYSETMTSKSMKSLIPKIINTWHAKPPPHKLHLDDVIQTIDQQRVENIYRVDTSERRETFATINPTIQTCLAPSKQRSVQTSYTNSKSRPIHHHMRHSKTLRGIPKDIAMELIRPRMVSKATSIRLGRQAKIEVKKQKNEAIIRQVQLDRFQITNKRESRRHHIQVEKNVVSFVITPAPLMSRSEQTDSKLLARSSVGSRCGGLRRSSTFDPRDRFSFRGKDKEGNSEIVCVWPPVKRKSENRRNAFFISVHSDHDASKNQPKRKFSETQSRIVQSYPERQQLDVSSSHLDTPECTGRLCKMNLEGQTYNSRSLGKRNYVVGYAKRASSLNTKGSFKNPVQYAKKEQQVSREKAKRRKTKRVPEIIDVTMPKQIRRNFLDYRAKNGQNQPGFVTVLSTPCDCPDVTIFIPCFCQNYECERHRTAHYCKLKRSDFKMVPLVEKVTSMVYE